MGLCKDCFHREVCESWTTINLDDIPPEIPCGHFKDTADVAPRAEVAKEIFAEIRQRWARRLFECGDFSFKDFKFEDFAGDLDELFKKYTEEDKK